MVHYIDFDTEYKRHGFALTNYKILSLLLLFVLVGLLMGNDCFFNCFNCIPNMGKIKKNIYIEAGIMYKI